MKWVQREKYIEVISELKSKLAMAEESIAMRRGKMRTMMKENKDLNSLFTKVVLEEESHGSTLNSLRGPLKAHSTL